MAQLPVKYFFEKFFDYLCLENDDAGVNEYPF
jgi:hypothetical protein